MKTKSLTLWLTALGPLALLAVGLAYGAWQELHAWPQVRQAVLAEVSRRNSEPPPVQPRQELDAKEDAIEVRQIDLMATALLDQAQSYDLLPGARQEPLVVADDTNAWPEAPLVSKLLVDAEPMFEKLDHLLKAREDLRYLGRFYEDLIEIRFRYSFYNGDLEKAGRTLRMLAQAVVANTAYLDVDSQIYFQNPYRYNRLYQLFARSLEHDRWSSEQLHELAGVILKPLDIPERLQAIRRNQQPYAISKIIQAYGLDWVDPSTFKWSPEIDSVYLLSILEASRVSDEFVTVNDLSKSISLLERPPVIRRAGVFAISTGFQGSTQSQAQMNLKWVPRLNRQSAFYLGGVENYRRLASVAVALKQFQIQHERWPESLDELLDEDENQGLVIVDVEGQRFDYAPARPGGTQLLRLPNQQFREAMSDSRPEIPSYLQKNWPQDLPDDSSWLFIR